MDLIALPPRWSSSGYPAPAARQPERHPHRRAALHPPTVSKTLNQLRDLLGDQLLYRQGNQLLLTPFAERLGPTLHRLLSELNGLTGQGGFDPASWQGQLKFALREWHGLAHGAHPGAADARVPGLVPDIRNKDEQGLAALAAGKLDFVILPTIRASRCPASKGWCGRPCARTSWSACCARSDPALARSWDLDAYLSWRHIAIRDQELANPFEQSLAQLQVRRQIAAILPDFGSAAALLRQSDLILTAIGGWAEQAAPTLW